MLLSSGDYCLCYPHTYLHYHGVRRQTEELLTREDANSMAALLKTANEESAVRLARVSVWRFLFRFVGYKSSFPKHREAKAEMTDVQCMAAELNTHLSPMASKLVTESLKHYEKTQRREVRLSLRTPTVRPEPKVAALYPTTGGIIRTGRDDNVR